MRDTAALQELLAPTTAALGYELLGCVYVPQGRQAILRVYIDSPEGITVDDCERVSRQLGAVLDVEDPIRGHYALEVSSPGMDRPLFTLAHFQRFIGAKVNIRLHMPVGERKHFKGVIAAVIAEEVIVECEDEKVTLPLVNIARANLVPDYERNLKGNKS